jgi:putative Mn2+ efflux pump MntP
MALAGTSKTQSEIQFTYAAFVCSWFCFLFMVHTMNRPLGSVSPWVVGGLIFAAAYLVIVGFAMRKKFFRQAEAALAADLPKALKLWKVAHIIGFCFAIDLAFFGSVLKFLGSNWLVPGIFFGLSLVFLLLWRPRQLAYNPVQPTL